MAYFPGEYLLKLLSNRNQLFRDLKPKDRIVKLIETHIVPGITHTGFTFVKSRMQLERKAGDFRQQIWFRTNSKNSKDELVEFAIHLRVENDEYAAFRKKFNYSPCNNILISKACTESTFITESAEYLNEWDNHLMNYWYELHLEDNRSIVNTIVQNINHATNSYLNINSDFETSLDYRVRTFKNLPYYGLLWIPDILILSEYIQQKNIQLEIIESYENWKQTNEGKNDVEEGVEIYTIIDAIILKLNNSR